jgi:hypothetical protein
LGAFEGEKGCTFAARSGIHFASGFMCGNQFTDDVSAIPRAIEENRRVSVGVEWRR